MGVACFVFAVFAPVCGFVAVVKTFVFGSTRVICVKCGTKRLRLMLLAVLLVWFFVYFHARCGWVVFSTFLVNHVFEHLGPKLSVGNRGVR